LTRHRYAAAALRGTTRARRIRANAADRFARIGGRRDPMLPPRTLIDTIGGGDYVAVGDRFFDVFKLAGLKPTDDVLDVGCGVGRMARPLAGWLEGRYEGFDPSSRAIRWCSRNISPLYENFTFTHVDVANDLYNPRGELNPKRFEFPYEDNSFDFAVLTSVFTHMQPAGLLRYLDELARVVRPGGQVFATYFLLDRVSERALDNGEALVELPEAKEGELGPYRLADGEKPSSAVAYQYAAVRKALLDRHLRIAKRWRGRWSGGVRAKAFQDIVVSRTAPAA
jgi:SAM-dependent methyltransferase